MRYLMYLFSTIAAISGCNIPRHSFERIEVVELEPEQLSALDLSTFNGNVEVEPMTDSADPGSRKVVLQITYKGYGATEEEAEEQSLQLGHEIRVEQGRLIIEATKPSGFTMASVAFKAKTPADCPLTMKTSNGAIQAKGFHTEYIDAHTSNGKIIVKDSTAAITGKTSNGTISLENTGGTIQLETSNGKVLFAGKLMGEDNEIRTSNGRIELKVEPENSVELVAKTSNGSIECKLPDYRVLDEGKRSLHAILGSGADSSTKLKVRTSNGRIAIEEFSEQASQEPHSTDSEHTPPNAIAPAVVAPEPPSPPSPPTDAEISSEMTNEV